MQFAIYSSITSLTMLNFYMLKMTVKFTLALALCYWLFTNGKLDFSLVTKSFQVGYFWLLGVIFFAGRFLLNTARFKVLLDAKTGHKLPYLKILSFDAVGIFFSVLLPGATAGDVVRFFYYRKIDNALTKSTLATVLILDRLIGLIGLLALGSVVCIIQYESIKSINVALLSIVYINILLFIIVSSILVFLFTDLVSKDNWLTKFANLFIKWPKIHSIILEILNVKIPIKAFIKSFFVSFVSQFVMVLGFWVLTLPFIPSDVSFLNLMAVIPIGLIGSTLPIAPAGLGVGHILFDNLFRMVNVDQGASLFNLSFLANVFVSLLGIFPYLILKHDLKKI